MSERNPTYVDDSAKREAEARKSAVGAIAAAVKASDAGRPLKQLRDAGVHADALLDQFLGNLYQCKDAPTGSDILRECLNIAELLLHKNTAYGDSALDPVRVFSKASTVEQIRVRLDDKLSRLSRGSAAGEDVEQDLMGYLVLLRIARKKQL